MSDACIRVAHVQHEALQGTRSPPILGRTVAADMVRGAEGRVHHGRYGNQSREACLKSLCELTRGSPRGSPRAGSFHVSRQVRDNGPQCVLAERCMRAWLVMAPPISMIVLVTWHRNDMASGLTSSSDARLEMRPPLHFSAPVRQDSRTLFWRGLKCKPDREGLSRSSSMSHHQATQTCCAVSPVWVKDRQEGIKQQKRRARSQRW